MGLGKLLGLMRCWNLFSDGKRFGKEEYVAYMKWLGENVSASDYELWTRLAIMRARKVIGFVGWVTYEIKDEESEWNKMTRVLARFAESANVGGNRTGGFGVVRLALKS